jgi:hypothetical protein
MTTKFKPTQKQTEQQFFALDRDTYAPASELIKVVGIGNDHYIRFSANDLKFCSVLSVTAPDNAVALLGAGIENAEQAQEFLRKYGLDHLIEDRSWETAELLNRKVSPIYYAEMCAKGMASSVPEQNVDAAEAHSIKALRDWQHRPATIAQRVQNGVIRWDDIKAVGATRLVKFDPEGIESVKSLVDMAKGETQLNSAGLRALIDHVNATPGANTAPRILLGLAQDFGSQFVINLYHREYAHRLSSSLKIRDKASVSESLQEIVAYGDAMCRHQRDRGYQQGEKYAAVAELWQAGVDIKVAVEGLNEGQSAAQIIAIHREGIAPSVSGGWL